MRELPKGDSGDEFIQFRGRQTSVVLDGFGIRFTIEQKDTPDGVSGFRAHKPLPVAPEEDIRAGDAPDDAVAAELAEELVEGELSNPLISYGVVCEYPDEDGEYGVCGEVFEDPGALNGHMSTHYGSDGKQRDDGSSTADTEEDADDGGESE